LQLTPCRKDFDGVYCLANVNYLPCVATRIHVAFVWPVRYATGDIRLERIERGRPDFVLYNPDVHSVNGIGPLLQ